jgi:hypothetical protein
VNLSVFGDELFNMFLDELCWKFLWWPKFLFDKSILISDNFPNFQSRPTVQMKSSYAKTDNSIFLYLRKMRSKFWIDWEMH